MWILIRKKDIEHFTHTAPEAEVAENNFDLSVSKYVEPEDTREKIDIKELNKEIESIVARENELRAAIDKIIAEIEADE